MNHEDSVLVEGFERIWSGAAVSADGDRCLVTTSPDARERLREAFERVRTNESQRDSNAARSLASLLRVQQPNYVGFEDGLIVPGSYFPAGTSADHVRNAAADQPPLHGTVRIVVVLVDFADREMTRSKEHFDELFFSTGSLPNGSVTEYFAEVSNDLVDITGEVVGPYRLPETLSTYANGESGTGRASPNARTMARDAVRAADPNVDFGPYDNDGDGFVDAFIVIHAGSGAEQTLNPNDIWSHKWVLSGGEYVADTSKIYAYLTVPEDCRIGVCCHELGHLLFGWPDLYDTDASSEGVGNWCLMAGGSWNGGGTARPGDVPAHPSAWCKADQDWVSVTNHTSSGPVAIRDVKDGGEVHRLWKNGDSGDEYFLVENRQRRRYDSELPGEGLLVYHVDDSLISNSDETHYKVGLEQADGNRDLETARNRGDAGDPFPGSADNRTFNGASTPHSRSHNGVDTAVAITDISDAGPLMHAHFSVTSGEADYADLEARVTSLERHVTRLQSFHEREHRPQRRRSDLATDAPPEENPNRVTDSDPRA